ncbi:MAG TPA: ATP-dependent helicase, partial [Spirochaetia bacterium]|nr:ATP-dependent helicase [Spirochaetia bacterium]
MAESLGAGDLLRITPSGHLVVAAQPGVINQEGPDIRRIVDAFGAGTAEGLFELAARPVSGGLAPQLAYWRDFAARYLSEVCHTPAGVTLLDHVPQPAPDDMMALLLAVPPMPGAEYLSAETLAAIWTALDAWVRSEAESTGGLEKFLTTRAPLWRQVGRVCFHLAENKKDPSYPFAFLATYAPRLSDPARIRYQPLGRALQEFAGDRNRKALVHLLTPVQRASEESALIRELVDSGDIYHALAWTPDIA